jgi:hypothetical protein
VLNQSALVLESVTLAQVVELVVKVLVDLAGGTVADEEAAENTHAAHPEELAVIGRHPSVKTLYFILSPRRLAGSVATDR